MRLKKRLSQINESGSKAYISKIVVLETAWVLTSVFEFEDRVVIDALDNFSQLSMISLEDPDLITRLKGLYSDKGPGLADQLILADYIFNDARLSSHLTKKPNALMDSLLYKGENKKVWRSKSNSTSQKRAAGFRARKHLDRKDLGRIQWASLMIAWRGHEKI